MPYEQVGHNLSNLKTDVLVVQLQDGHKEERQELQIQKQDNSTETRQDDAASSSTNDNGIGTMIDGEYITDLSSLLPKTSALMEAAIMVKTPIFVKTNLASAARQDEVSTNTMNQIDSLESPHKPLDNEDVTEDLNIQKPVSNNNQNIPQVVYPPVKNKPDNSPVKKSGGYFFGFGQSKIVPTTTTIPESDVSKTFLDDHKNYLRRQCQLGEAPIRCYVVRDKGMMGFYPSFRLYMEADNGRQDKFLMSCSKSVLTNSGAHFLFSTDKTPGDRETASTLGKLRCKDDGSHFYLYDTGESAKNAKDPSTLRKELALIHFQKTSTNDAASMTCWLPCILPDGSQAVWQPLTPQQSMNQAVAEGRTDSLIRLSHKADALDYKGRVTESSSKNFQLVSTETGSDTVLLFGKSKLGTIERFSMDVQYPLSPLQAFSICVAVLDKTSRSILKY